VSVIKPSTVKTLIESKLEMDKSELKKNFLEFVAYLKKMDVIHDEHCHVVDHKEIGGSGTKNMGKNNDAGGQNLKITLDVAAIRCLAVIERSPEIKDRRTRVALEISRPRNLRLVLTQEVCGRKVSFVRLSSHQ
jgi:hypothetical protein